MKPTSGIAINKPKNVDYLPAFDGSSLGVKLYLPKILPADPNHISKHFTKNSIFIFNGLETMDICNKIVEILEKCKTYFHVRMLTGRQDLHEEQILFWQATGFVLMK